MRIYDPNGLLKKNQTVVPTMFNRGAQWVSNSGPIVLPTNDVDVVIPYVCTLKSVIILTAGGPGSCVVNVWAAPYASFPPTAANDVTGGVSPLISSGIKYQNTTLAGWTTAFNPNDVIRFHLASASILSRVAITLEFQ